VLLCERQLREAFVQCEAVSYSALCLVTRQGVKPRRVARSRHKRPDGSWVVANTLMWLMLDGGTQVSG